MRALVQDAQEALADSVQPVCLDGTASSAKRSARHRSQLSATSCTPQGERRLAVSGTKSSRVLPRHARELQEGQSTNSNRHFTPHSTDCDLYSCGYANLYCLAVGKLKAWSDIPLSFCRTLNPNSSSVQTSSSAACILLGSRCPVTVMQKV